VDRTPIFQEIAESIRQEILYGTLEPHAELPTVRDMAEKWGCAPGTVLRAYQELASQGLIVSRPGAGTHVASGAASAAQTPLRRAALINQAETFLLSAMSSGYTVDEISQAVQMALDRWRALADITDLQPAHELRFVGSHDPALTLLTSHFAEQLPDTALSLSFAGSLGGLMALARHEADIAGAHLWDVETDTYNQPFVRRLLPGQRVALLNLADRRMGLIVTPGNPLNINDLTDLTKPDARFINRQSGAGTRVWLDAQLHALGIVHADIEGYEDEALTHSEVAGAINEGRADVGLGIEAAALAYGLDFVPLTTESYDLIIPEDQWERRPVQTLAKELTRDDMKAAINGLGGYDISRTGSIEWVF